MKLKNKNKKFFFPKFSALPHIQDIHKQSLKRLYIKQLKTFIITPRLNSSFLIHGKTKTEAINKFKKTILKWYTVKEL
jgi:hypothetical protein